MLKLNYGLTSVTKKLQRYWGPHHVKSCIFSFFRPVCLSSTRNQTAFPRYVAGGGSLLQLFLRIPCTDKYRDSCQAQFPFFEKEKGLDALLAPPPDQFLCGLQMGSFVGIWTWSEWPKTNIMTHWLDTTWLRQFQVWSMFLGSTELRGFIQKGKGARDSGKRARCYNT
jgi:hypothetical protein